MNRRSFIQNSALTFGALTLARQNIFSALFSKSNAAAAPFMFHMMTDKIGVFTESGGTIGFMIDKKGVVVVDAQFPTTAPHMISELQKKNRYADKIPDQYSSSWRPHCREYFFQRIG